MCREMPNINNVNVYWLNESMVASGYPMLTEYKADMEKQIAENLDVHSKRAVRLGKAPIGSWHDNFLNWVVVQFDLGFSVKAWYEAQRYHFLDFVSSMSTMHRLTQMDMDSIFNKYVDDWIKAKMKKLVQDYLDNPTDENKLKVLYNCPMWVEFTARMTTNYRQLKTIYNQRRNHLLPDWQEFCDWIETLPHSELITWE